MTDVENTTNTLSTNADDLRMALSVVSKGNQMLNMIKGSMENGKDFDRYKWQDIISDINTSIDAGSESSRVSLNHGSTVVPLNVDTESVHTILDINNESANLIELLESAAFGEQHVTLPDVGVSAPVSFQNMVDIEKFKSDALRTESLIDSVQLNKALFDKLTTAYIGIGNAIDQVKKNAFYGKPFNVEQFDGHTSAASAALTDISSLDASETESIAINPRIFHGTIGIATESVELVESLKVAIDGGEVDFVNMGEEVFDCNWYEQILLDELGINWKTAMATGITKLKNRFPEKFTSEKAINRDLDNERNVLEEGMGS